MQRNWTIGTLALVAAASLLAALPADAQEEPDPETLFRTRCANCHTVPDRAVVTDRAWLDQVNRTA